MAPEPIVVSVSMRTTAGRAWATICAYGYGRGWALGGACGWVSAAGGACGLGWGLGAGCAWVWGGALGWAWVWRRCGRLWWRQGLGLARARMLALAGRRWWRLGGLGRWRRCWASGWGLARVGRRLRRLAPWLPGRGRRWGWGGALPAQAAVSSASRVRMVGIRVFIIGIGAL